MIFLLSLSVIPLTLSAALRKRIENVLPTFVSALIVAAYPLAMLRMLYVLPVCTLVTAVLCLVWVVAEAARGRGAALWAGLRDCALTPGMLAFVLLAALYLIRQGDHAVTATDDIYYWALEAKGIFAQGGLVGSALHLAPRFSSYTPGMQLFQWIGATVSGASEDGLLFAMLAIFYAVYLLPFAAHLPWRRVWLLPLYLFFAVALPTVINRDAYSMLRVDAALGVCLGYCLMLVWRLYRAPKASVWDAVSLALGLFVLALIKQIGAAWAMLPFSLLLILEHRRKGAFRAAKWGALLAILIAAGSWVIFCSANGLEGEHTASMRNNLTMILHSAFKAPESVAKMVPSLLRAFANIPERGPGVPSPLLGVPILGWLLALLAFPLVLAAIGRQKARSMTVVSLWFFACVTLYVVIFSLFFPLLFTGVVDTFIDGGGARLQYLMERYFGPGLIGVLCLMAAITADGVALPRARRFTLVAALCALLAVTCNWQQLGETFLLANYPKDMPQDIQAAQAENDWTNELDDPLHSVVLYGLNPTPEKRERFQYALAPVKVVTFYGELDDVSFRTLLRGKRVTHILCMDDQNPTYALASPYVKEGDMETLTPYRLTWDGDVPVLTP